MDALLEAIRASTKAAGVTFTETRELIEDLEALGADLREKDAKDWQRVINRLDAGEKTVEKLQKANAECEQRAVRQWYESPVLWFGLGAATVLVAGTTVVLIADKRAGAP